MKNLNLNDRTKRIIAITICAILVCLSIYNLVFTRFRYFTEEYKIGFDTYETTVLRPFGDRANKYFPFMAFFLPIVASTLLCVYIMKFRIPINIKPDHILIAALVFVFFSELTSVIHHLEHLDYWFEWRTTAQRQAFNENNLHTNLVLICVPIMSFGIYKKWRPLVVIPAIIIVFAYISRINEFYSYEVPRLAEDYNRFTFWTTPPLPLSQETYGNARPYVWEILFFATVAVISYLRMPAMKLQQRTASPRQRLEFLKEQFEAGNITKEEYDEKRAEILSQL